LKLDFCVACGKKSDLHNHHLIPKSRGGTNRTCNLITLCYGCHRKLHGLVGKSINHRELIKAGIKKKKADGGRWANAVYGYDFVDGKTIVNKKEQEVIKIMLRLREDGLTYRRIASMLDEMGFLAKCGGSWATSSVAQILGAHTKK